MSVVDVFAASQNVDQRDVCSNDTFFRFKHFFHPQSSHDLEFGLYQFKAKVLHESTDK